MSFKILFICDLKNKISQATSEGHTKLITIKITAKLDNALKLAANNRTGIQAANTANASQDETQSIVQTSGQKPRIYSTVLHVTFKALSTFQLQLRTAGNDRDPCHNSGSLCCSRMPAPGHCDATFHNYTASEHEPPKDRTPGPTGGTQLLNEY